MKRSLSRPGSPAPILRATRVVVVVHLLLVLVQAAFAGQFLGGYGAALRWHELNGTVVIMSVALGQCILGAICWRRKLLPAGFFLGSVALYVSEGAQIGFGFNRRLALHVPLGVAIFGGVLILALLAFKKARPPAEGKG